MNKIKVGFIGLGNMGSALASAVAKTSAYDLYVTDIKSENVEKFVTNYNAVASTNYEILAVCDFIFLGVKPQVLPELLKEIKITYKACEHKAVFVSMAAGVQISSIEAILSSDASIIRIMPNLPVASGNGVVLCCSSSNVSQVDEALFSGILSKAGMTDWLPEHLFDCASALSGCGPAFVAMFADAMADGAVSCGLPRDKAIKYAVMTLLGTASYLNESNIHPSVLKDMVCSPGGSTIKGVEKLEEGAFRSTVINAVQASYKKTVELGEK